LKWITQCIAIGDKKRIMKFWWFWETHWDRLIRLFSYKMCVWGRKQCGYVVGRLKVCGCKSFSTACSCWGMKLWLYGVEQAQPFNLCRTSLVIVLILHCVLLVIHIRFVVDGRYHLSWTSTRNYAASSESKRFVTNWMWWLDLGFCGHFAFRFAKHYFDRLARLYIAAKLFASIITFYMKKSLISLWKRMSTIQSTAASIVDWRWTFVSQHTISPQASNRSHAFRWKSNINKVWWALIQIRQLKQQEMERFNQGEREHLIFQLCCLCENSL